MLKFFSWNDSNLVYTLFMLSVVFITLNYFDKSKTFITLLCWRMFKKKKIFFDFYKHKIDIKQFF